MLKIFTSLATTLPRYNFAKQITFEKWSIIKGDKVIINAGKDYGKMGTVLRVYRKTNRVLVQGMNQKFKRTPANEEGSAGGVQQVSRSIHVSNVALIDPEKGIPAKIKRGYLEDGTAVRVSKLSGSIIEKPRDPAHQQAHRHKNKTDGVKDTTPAEAIKITYLGEDFAGIKEQFEREIAEKERKEALLWFEK